MDGVNAWVGTAKPFTSGGVLATAMARGPTRIEVRDAG